jgi:hypothetical protein
MLIVKPAARMQTELIVAIVAVLLILVIAVVMHMRGAKAAAATTADSGAATTAAAPAKPAGPTWATADGTKYGALGADILNCVRKSNGLNGATRQCMLSAHGNCSEQGLLSAPQCALCGSNVAQCNDISTVYANMRSDGVLPPYPS